MRYGLIALFLLLPIGCDWAKDTSEDVYDFVDEPIGEVIDFIPDIALDLEAIPALIVGQGEKVLSAVSGAVMSFDARTSDPVTTLGDCTHWILQCAEPNARSLDDCFRSAPVCQTIEPWREGQACCPSACYTDYATQRRSGVEPYAAFDSVFFQQGTCIPGLSALKQGS